MDEAKALSRMIPPSQPRPSIWRNGVMQIHITRACDKACFACTQGSQLGGKPVMISLDEYEQALKSITGYFGVVGMFGGNPCLAGGTPVYTTAGIYPIEELEGKVFHVKNLHGEPQPATCWLTGERKLLYEIKLRGGHSYFATADHEWPALALRYGANHKRKDLPDYCPRKVAVPLGKVKTTDLEPGMRLPIVTADSLGFGDTGDSEDGFLAGWLLGDGWVSKKAEKRERQRVDGGTDCRFAIRSRVRHAGMIVNEADHASGIAAKLSAVLKRQGSLANWRAVKKCYVIGVANNGVDDWLEYFGVLGKADGLPALTWTRASEAFRKGLIDGLFSADGNVEVSRKRRYTRIRLTSAHEKLIRDVSTLLGFYGIKTQIDFRMRKGSFPNGVDYGCDYASYTLSISNAASVERFARLFPLTHVKKNARLQAAIGVHKTNDVESTNIEIVSVEPTDRYENVWDISVGDSTHCFQLAHCVTGNCMHPKFAELCEILRSYFPKEQCGLWCNHPKGKGAIARETFNPAVSNLNVHQDQEAYDEFAATWPECRGVLKGLDTDSRHSPPFVSMKDVGIPEGERWNLISNCDINKFWSAMICSVPGKGLRAFFCEIAGAMAMLHADDPNWPDHGLKVTPGWWRRPMSDFAQQVRTYCHQCGIPLRRYGQLANGGEYEEVSQAHQGIYKPKVKDRKVALITLDNVQSKKLNKATDYIQNGSI